MNPTPSPPPLAALAGGWGIGGAQLQALGDGHINDTLLVSEAEGARFVLQRISRVVFTDPDRVMANLQRVQRHLQIKNAADLTPGLRLTLMGNRAWVDPQGDWWRLWDYVADARSLSSTRDPAVSHAAGRAFGRLQRLLSDLPGPPLESTIPGFLELQGYLDRFDRVCARTAGANKSALAINEAVADDEFIDRSRSLADRFPRGQNLIHGDCKLNNLLFAPTQPRVRAVVDLDTIMVGHWAWDFGDLARSVLSGVTHAGSDPGQAPGDLSREGLALFRSLVEGFAVGSERRNMAPEDLAAAPVYIAFMLGIRFLTDHLEGDRYFKVSQPGENLDRARAQFRLVQDLPVEQLAEVAAQALKAAITSTSGNMNHEHGSQ